MHVWMQIKQNDVSHIHSSKHITIDLIPCVAPTTTTTKAPATTTIAKGKNRSQMCINACVYPIFLS